VILWLQNDIVITTALVATLTYASISDLKSREVHEAIWIPALLLVIAKNVIDGTYSHAGIIKIALSLSPALIVFIMSLLNLMGGADALALLLIGLAHPNFKLIPIALETLIVSLIPPIFLVIYYTALNILRNRKFFNNIRCSKGIKSSKVLISLGRPMTIKEFLSAKFVYPLTIPLGNGNHECRTYFSDDATELKIRKHIEKLVKEGIIHYEDKIITTPALPHILFILIGYAFSILLPPEIIINYFISS